MKIWLMILSAAAFAGLSGTALAVDAPVTAEPAVAAPNVKSEKAATPAPKPVRAAHKRSHRTFPRGDIRQCLDHKSYAEVIRCSEQRRP